MPKVIISIDGVVVKEVALDKDRSTVGRRPYNDIVIDNLAVSGEHAAFHRAEGEVFVEDLDSTNGTFVNARAVKKRILHNDDVVEIGKFKLRYLVSDERSGSGGAAARATGTAAPAPLPLVSAPTMPAPLEGAKGQAVMRVLSGSGAGRELPLKKVVTTVGKPGVAVAAVTRRLQGYAIVPVDGGTLVNGQSLGSEPIMLQDGDMLELAGIRMQFSLG